MTLVVDAVAQGRLYKSMVTPERRDLHAVAFIDDAFADVLTAEHGTLRRQLFVHIAAHMDVEGIGLFEMFPHVSRSGGAPHLQRNIPSHDPTRQPEIGNSNHVIGMKMSEEECGDG